jgi:hypothetical protein
MVVEGAVVVVEDADASLAGVGDPLPLVRARVVPAPTTRAAATNEPIAQGFTRVASARGAANLSVSDE